MLTVSTMNVSLTDELRTFVEQRVSRGSYASTSEYVRELIRTDRDRTELRALVLEGATSPVAATADSDYFAALRTLADAQR